MSTLAQKAQELKRLAQDFLYKGQDAQAALEAVGLQLLPFTFYSPVPSVAELQSGWERQSDAPFFEPFLYDNLKMMDFLDNCLAPFASEFTPPRIAEDGAGTFYWHNPSFSYSDAMALYCVVRYLKPGLVLEIGSGFSTLIIDLALRANGSGRRISIDPFPRDFITQLCNTQDLIEDQVQNIPLEFFAQLRPRDILFVDSSHSVRQSSDCTFIYLKVIPKLGIDVFIHSHDIFLPDPLPLHWGLNLQLHWNEQYILQALLLGNQYEVLYRSYYHFRYNRKALESFMGGKYPPGGSSFWYRRRQV